MKRGVDIIQGVAQVEKSDELAKMIFQKPVKKREQK
jgi:hypothetical protein